MENKITQNVLDPFQKVQPVSEQVLAIFYPKSFKKRMSLGALLKEGMKEQGEKLMMTLSMVVNSPANIQTLLPTLENLGKRHIEYAFQMDCTIS